jgi:O-acetylserine/cysteine efflux transporter
VPFALLVPVFGIASAWVFLAEVPTGAEMAGALVVLAGLGLTVKPPAASLRHLDARGDRPAVVPAVEHTGAR